MSLSPAEWYAAQPVERVTVCNLCGESYLGTVSEEDRYGLPVQVVKCDDCGLKFISPRMNQESYDEFYRDGIYRRLLSDYYGREITPESLEPEQARYAAKVAQLLQPFVGNAETLLDIGGSTGVVAKALSLKFGLRAVVLEPSEAEAARAEKRGLTVFCGTVPKLGTFVPKMGIFDVVLLCQTVDHLLDISGALKAIHSQMAEGAVFFMDAVMTTEPKLDHPFYLDWGTVTAFLMDAGFKIQSRGADADGIHANFVCKA